MSVINKDLGVVTAYAYAVKAGYTGTEEEFEQALGDLAELVTDFENFTVEVTTLEPGSSATASYANGVLSLGIPEGEKGDTGATPNLTIGTVTTLAPGSNATATITGTDEAPVLSLGIPEGDPGEVPAAALASDFSASVSYKKGDYVWQSGTLYKFTADHAAGAWTGSDATAAKVADDVANLSSAIVTKQPLITHAELLTQITKNCMSYGGNYYPGSDGTKTSLGTQSWYEVTALNDFHVWTDSEFSYSSIMIAVYNNGTATKQNFVARYRKSSTENTLPTSASKLSVTTGQLLVISVQSDADFVFLSDGMATGMLIFDNGILLSDDMLDQEKVSVSVGTDKYMIKFGDYLLAFDHIVNANTRANLWNFNGISKNGQTILGGGTDIIGVIRESGESDYMGGVHGDETNVDFYILADGVPITADVSCDRVDILMHSHLTRVSTGDNIIDRVAHVCITNGCIEVEATFTALENNIVCSSVCAGGMWAWYEADKVYATSNIGALVGTGASGLEVQKDHELYTATAVLNDATIICENLIGMDTPGSFGQAYYYGNEANPRMKIYLGALKDITLNTGDITKGKARYTLM